ncbi:MAG: flagellar assembly protein T N-terminal domain-containing protein [Syntrophales bacterium]|nr:flagellar assembly protein T N-terminal domain-containing protein [Syntrophales bacterium]
MKRTVFLMMVIGAVFLCGIALAQHKILSEGMATIHSNLVDIARDKAIDNAQRNAVEKAVGVMVTSSTEVENFQLKLDRILSESRGFINTYRIISEKREGDTYQVTIEANVGMGKLKERIEAINIIMTRKSKPRLMIIFSGQAQKDAIAEAAMTRYFIAKGFKLVDAKIVRKNREYEHLQTLTEDQKMLAKVGHYYGAEVVIIGSVDATCNSFTVENIEVYSNKVTVSIKLINADTGEIIATDSESGSAPGTKGDIKLITEEASVKLAKKMMEETLERWSSELTNTVTVKLLVSGLDSYQDLMRFKYLLSMEVKGFKEVYQRSYVQGQVELDLEIEGNTQGLADDIAAITINDRKVKILKITQNKIEAMLLP